jgi:TusA-related sulfurtransferase
MKKTLNITGKVCPYCVLAVQKETTTMKPGDELVVISDHPPAATTSIPQFALDNGMEVGTKKTAPGIWEITLAKK